MMRRFEARAFFMLSRQPMNSCTQWRVPEALR